VTYVFTQDEHTWGAAMTRFHLTCSAMIAPLLVLIKGPAGVNKITVAMTAALLVISTVAASAQARHAQRHAWSRAGIATSSFARARMIEVRPGLWVGSYQCITDLDRGGRDCSSGN
jgi:2-phosphoglycerate kinase